MSTKGIPHLILAIFLMLLISCEDEDEVVINKPTVSILSVTNVTTTSAQSGGNITDDGGGDITSRGIVWSTELNPTAENNDGLTIDGIGSGIFQSTLTNLQPNTTYYLSAYATNESGISYSLQESFTTLDEGGGSGDETQIVDVINPNTGKTWMDRNLGATRAATSINDVESYGDLYQWGRSSDGHQKRNSGTTTSLSTSDTPGHDDFIVVANNPKDWRSPQNDDLWQGVNGTNNPCPEGYRLPSEAELNAELLSWNENSSSGAFSSPLKLPEAGSRSNSDGLIGSGYGRIWSSTINGTDSHLLLFSSHNAVITSSYRANGNSVRCIKD